MVNTPGAIIKRHLISNLEVARVTMESVIKCTYLIKQLNRKPRQIKKHTA